MRLEREGALVETARELSGEIKRVEGVEAEGVHAEERAGGGRLRMEGLPKGIRSGGEGAHGRESP